MGRLPELRPGLLVLTSENGGLGHYVAHLWDGLKGRVEPVCVTYKAGQVDELLVRQIPDLAPIIDPLDRDTIDHVLSLAHARDIRCVNLHSGTRTIRYNDYYVELLRRFKRAGLAVVLHLHDVAIHDASAEKLGSVGRLTRLADAILVGSQQEGAVLRQRLNVASDRISLMRHGPYGLLTSGAPSRSVARAALGVPQQAPVVLSFGAYKKEKRLKDLVQAFNCVKSVRPDAILLLQTGLQHAHQDAQRVKAFGALPGVQLSLGYACTDRVRQLFRAADVVALAYERTAASGVLNLARAFRCPVVLTRCFEHATEVQGCCGFAVPERQPEALASALVRLLSISEAQRQRMGGNWASALPWETWQAAADALIHALYTTIRAD